MDSLRTSQDESPRYESIQSYPLIDTEQTVSGTLEIRVVMTKRIIKYPHIPIDAISMPMGPRGIDQVEEVELFQASNPTSHISVDVVFIHGFTDSWKGTWKIQGKKTEKRGGLIGYIDELDDVPLWPQWWLNKDMPNARIILVKYKKNLPKERFDFD